MIKETFYQMQSPISIALVTDTHNRPAGDVIQSISRNQPDIICIAGDFVYARLPEYGLKMEESPHALSLLKECSTIAPTFVSLGNHEWMFNDKDIKIVKSTGIHLLHNNYTRYRIREKEILIGGLTSASYMAYQAYCAQIPKDSVDPNIIYPLLKPRSAVIQDYEPTTGWIDKFCKESGYKILLCHHPEYYPRYLQKKRINLIFSGHAHGGQIRIKGQGLYAPGQGFLPKLTSGVVDNRLVISKGLANNTIIPRLWNPEEVVYIH